MKKFQIKKILVPTDFSQISTEAFPYAEDLANQYGAEIHLVYVIEKNPPILIIRSIDQTSADAAQKIEDDAKNLLNEFKAKFSNNVSVKPVLLYGNDFEEITNYAEKNNFDLIVIATHGRTGVLHTLLGSVAEKVIRYAKCPVLVITPQKAESEE